MKVRNFSIVNRSENPKTVYIYTDEGMIKGSPFISFSAAHFNKVEKPINQLQK